jgi:hypothetical protein
MLRRVSGESYGYYLPPAIVETAQPKNKLGKGDHSFDKE